MRVPALNHPIHVLMVLLQVAMIVCLSSHDAGAEPKSHPARLFIVHSYEAGHVCGQPQHDGILAALRQAGYDIGHNLKLGTYYMDTKRTNNTPRLIAEAAGKALEKIRAFQPDIVVTLDDNAFRTVALALVDTSIPVVFSGLNAFPEEYNQSVRFMESPEQPGHNITGVHENLHVSDALRVHKHLFPETRAVLFLCDVSPTGIAITKQIMRELKESPPPCRWSLKVVRTWEEYKKEILTANDDPDISAIYPVALLLKDQENTTYTAPEIFRWTTAHSNKPEIAVNYAFVQMGLFGGAAVDFYAMGKQAGQMVIKILRGTSPGDIPLEEASRYALAFNLDRAIQLGIQIPEDVLLAADHVEVSRWEAGKGN